MARDEINRKFLMHRSRERTRGCRYELTYGEWAGIWERSGQWNNRGVAVGNAVMQRRDPAGPWSTDNVEVVVRERAPPRPRASESQRAIRIEPPPRPVKNDRSYLVPSYPDGVVFHVSEWRAHAVNT